METCPHCHASSFSTIRHALFTREGSIHACPACAGRAGVPWSPTLALMALTATPAFILARDLADGLFALLAVVPVALALLVWWRGRFSLVAVGHDVARLPRPPVAQHLMPAAAVALGILVLAGLMQLAAYSLDIATPEERIRYGLPTELRSSYRAAVERVLDGRFSYAQMNPSLQTIDRQDRYLTLAIKEGNLEAVLGMARPGTDVDAPDAKGDTPLALALGRRRFDMAEALMAAGADPDRTTRLGEAPLVSFARNDEQYAAQVAWLIEHGAGISNPAVIEAVFQQGGDYAKALLSWRDAPIPPSHAEQARSLRQWLLALLSECGGADFAHDYVRHPYAGMQAARTRGCH